MKKIFLTIFTALMILNATLGYAATYCVRSDGGTNIQCDGQVDLTAFPSGKAYDGSGTGEDCCLNHPDWVMPMAADSTENENTMNAANDVIVLINGSYRIGCKDPTDCVDAAYNSNTGTCNTSATYGCDPRPVNNGVKIVGCTWTGDIATSGCGCTYRWGGATTCTTTRPTLWGAGNVAEVVDVSGSTNVTIKDIEITDHENCNLFTIFTCRESGDMSAPNKLSAQLGINAANATNLTLIGVNNHGVGYEAMRVNNVSTMTLTGCNLDYAMTGMNNDTSGSCTTCGLSGTMLIDKSSANHNGCMEDWQNPGTPMTDKCCSQTQSCSSADAIGFNNTGGAWIIRDSDMSYNTADGPDFLYLNRGSYSGGTLLVERSRIEGNAGNGVKGPNAMTVQHSYILANCGKFANQTYTTYDKAQSARSGTSCDNDAVCDSNENSINCGWCDAVGCGGDGDGVVDAGEGDCPVFDHCRSNTGAPFSIEFKSGDATTPKIYNNTVSSNGDISILTSGTCTAGIDVIAQGNIFIGGYQWNDDNENPYVSTGGDGLTDLWYSDGGTCAPDFVEDYNTIVGQFKETDWSGVHTVVEPTLSDVFLGAALQGPYTTTGYFQSDNYHLTLYLNPTSSALGVSNEVESGSSALDFNSYARGASWDGGATEEDTEVGGGGAGNGTAPSISLRGGTILLRGGKVDF